ncbi:MAG: M48 family metallopeptidase [Bacteroidia bacterium]
MRKLIWCIVTSIFLAPQIWAQDFDQYQPLESSGTIPESFVTLTESKVIDDIERIDRSEKRKIRKEKEKFVLVNNYLIDQLLLSGRVLYNDPVGRYINNVADHIIEANPDLADKERIQIYVVKSTVVNAFAYDNGSIFINLGLIAQLENEAQLAYILSHELVHFQKRHAINSYIEYDRISRGKSQYKQTSPEDRIIAQSNYSKELELEADKHGLEYLENTLYDPNSVYGVFDVLQYSFLPFDDVPFPKSYFESDHLKFPEDYFLEETNVIEVAEDYDDSRSTHPNVRTRREAIREILFSEVAEEKKEFLVSEEEFKKVRDLARFELCRLYLQSRDYSNAIYAAFMLQYDYPESSYLKEVIATALYNLTTYRHSSKYEFNRLIEDPENMQGSSQQLNHFLRKLTNEEMNVMALRYVWSQKQTLPENPVFASLSDSLMKSLVYNTDLTLRHFSEKALSDTLSDTLAQELAIDSTEYLKLSKYEKIKLNQKLKEQDENDGEFSFTRYAFVDLLQDPEFTRKYESYLSSKTTVETKTDKWGRKIKKTTSRKEKKRLELKGASLGIEKIVVVDPYYLKSDARKKTPVQFVKSEINQQEFSKLNAKNAALAGLDIEVIDPNTFDEDDTEKFNDYTVLNEWIRERFGHEDQDNAIVSSHQQAAKLIDKYGTRYFLWTGLVSTRYKKSFPLGYFLIGTVYWFLLPPAIVSLFIPEYDTYYYSLLFDLETGKVVFFNSQNFENSDRRDFVNSFVYDSFYQISKSN